MLDFLEHFPVGGTFEQVDAFDGFEGEGEEESSRSVAYGRCGGFAVARIGGFEEDGGGGGRIRNGLVGLAEEVVVKSNEWWCNTWCSGRWWSVE